MGIHIKEVLPLLELISKQQGHISDRLTKLIGALGDEPEPVEPLLRAMLKPVAQDIQEMRTTLTGEMAPPTASPGSSVSPSA
jgi:hypothetical protein